MQDWTPENLKSELVKDQKVFLKLWKNGCGACKLSIPATERLEAEFKNVAFGQISIDDYPEMLEISDSEVLPAFFVFDSGKLKNKIIGFKGIAKLKEMFV